MGRGIGGGEGEGGSLGGGGGRVGERWVRFSSGWVGEPDGPRGGEKETRDEGSGEEVGSGEKDRDRGLVRPD